MGNKRSFRGLATSPRNELFRRLARSWCAWRYQPAAKVVYHHVVLRSATRSRRWLNCSHCDSPSVTEDGNAYTHPRVLTAKLHADDFAPPEDDRCSDIS